MNSEATITTTEETEEQAISGAVPPAVPAEVASSPGVSPPLTPSSVRKNPGWFAGKDDPRRWKGGPQKRRMADLRAAIQQFLSRTDATGGKRKQRLERLIGKMYEQAMKSDMVALRLLLEYGYGKPVQQVDFGQGGIPLLPLPMLVSYHLREYSKKDVKEGA